MSGAYARARLDKLRESEKELEDKLFARGSEEPTQPNESENEGSPEGHEELTAGQQAEDLTKDNPGESKTETKDLEYYREEAREWKQRFSISKAKYDDNIRKLKAENIELQNDRVELRNQLNKARQELTKSQPNKVDEAFDTETVEVLGEKTSEAIKKLIADQAAEIEALKAERENQKIEREKASIQQQVQTEYNKFEAELAELVPDYKELNSDDGFLDFLDGVNSVGRIRFDLLRDAEKGRDAERVAQFFLDYKKIVADKKKKKGDSLNSRIAPKGEGGSDHIVDHGKDKIWTIQEINDFNRAVQKGDYRGRHSERQKIEAEIDRAYLAGRVSGL